MPIRLLKSVLLLLISSQSFAGVGDIYNCEETSAGTIYSDGKTIDLNGSLTNFSFKRNESEIIKEQPLSSSFTSLKITSSNKEQFTAFGKDESDGFEYITYMNGVFISTSKVIYSAYSDNASVMSIIAKCRVN